MTPRRRVCDRLDELWSGVGDSLDTWPQARANIVAAGIGTPLVAAMLGALTGGACLLLGWPFRWGFLAAAGFFLVCVGLAWVWERLEVWWRRRQARRAKP